MQEKINICINVTMFCSFKINVTILGTWQKFVKPDDIFSCESQ